MYDETCFVFTKIVLVRYNIQTTCVWKCCREDSLYASKCTCINKRSLIYALLNHSIIKMLTLLVHMCMKAALIWFFSAMVVIALWTTRMKIIYTSLFDSVLIIHITISENTHTIYRYCSSVHFIKGNFENKYILLK